GGAPLDFDAALGFEIPAAVKSVTLGGHAYAILTAGGAPTLYSLTLKGFAAATAIGAIGGNPAILYAGLTLGDGPLVPTAVVTTGSPNPALIFSPVTLTATVSPANVTAPVDFNILYSNDELFPHLCHNIQPVGGVATCTVALTRTDDFKVTATYPG